MPRIHPRLLWQARAINSALSRLLPVCRELTSARNELRWMQEHAARLAQQLHHPSHTAILAGFVARRAHGEPLQYILGSEYFGDLELKCRSGVLIPRPETAASVSHLVSLIRDDVNGTPSPLRVLDLCTGSGCIPLLFHHVFYRESRRSTDLSLVGVDVSPEALGLARENLIERIASQANFKPGFPQRTRSLQSIGFVQADVLLDEHGHESDVFQSLSEALGQLNADSSKPSFDILISNPPYISPRAFLTTNRSVRACEPKLALVPPDRGMASDELAGDLFYPRLLQVAEQVNAKAALFEVSDLEQAKRVTSLALKQGVWSGVEIWRDRPQHDQHTILKDTSVKVRGAGHGRSVFMYRSEAKDWLRVGA